VPKMTLAWLVIYWGGLIASFVNPVYGLLVYLFEYYLRPSLHWWGKDVPDWRYSLIVSLVVLLTYFMNRSKLPEQRHTESPSLKWLLAFGLNMVIVMPLAVNGPESLDATIVFWKIIVLYGVIIAVVRTDWAFNAFIAVHIAGAGWWGWEAWRDPKRDAGRLLSVGSSDTLNDNQAAGHLLTVLPFVVLFLLMVKDKRLRALALCAGPLIINTFILCNSRGATVGIVAALVCTLLLAKRGHRRRLAAAGVGVIAAFFLLADPEFIMRQQTTLHYEDEATAQNRISNWGSGIALLKDRPLGAGGYGFNELSPIYAPEVTDGRSTGKVSPHNTWILVATEWGVQGFVLFVAFILATFRILHRIRAETTDPEAYYRSLAIQIGLIGTLAASTFSDRLYGESIYWLCALAVVAHRIHKNSEALPAEPVADRPSPCWRAAEAAGAA